MRSHPRLTLSGPLVREGVILDVAREGQRSLIMPPIEKKSTPPNRVLTSSDGVMKRMPLMPPKVTERPPINKLMPPIRRETESSKPSGSGR